MLWGGNSCMGYKLENKQLIIVPAEAEIVKKIFQLYIDGIGADTIGKILKSKGIKPKHSCKWNRSSIMVILSNFNYIGDLILQKTFRENHLSKRKIINSGELDRYVVKNNHEKIISKEVFDKVQKMRKLKAKRIKSRSVKKHYAFTGMMRCGICGRAYTHKATPYKEIWKCSLSVTTGQDSCASKQVPDNKIKEAANHILNRKIFDESFFKSKVERVVIMPEKRLVFHMKDGTSKEFYWKESLRSNSWTPEMRGKARIRALNQHKGVK